ncbi:MAG: hypothetical protein V3T61_05730 [Acidobacteriota bacterium]
MFRTILYLIALMVGFYLVFWKGKPEPFEPKEIDRTLDPDYPKAFIIHGGHRESAREPSKPKTRFVDRTLDPNYPRAFIMCRPWNGKSRGSTPLRTPKPPHKEG